MVRFMRSFRHAVRGIGSATVTERNFRIELAFVSAVTVFAFFVPLSSAERATVLLTMGAVLAFELVNTSFERLLDMLQPEYHEGVKVIKDLAAGAVLVVSVFAALVGIAIFFPYLSRFFF